MDDEDDKEVNDEPSLVKSLKLAISRKTLAPGKKNSFVVGKDKLGMTGGAS